MRAWRADKLVDELCAKDGGIRVYQKVDMPQISGAAQLPLVRHKNYRKDADEFYYVSSNNDIRGNSGSTDVGALALFRIETALYRAEDDKLLAVTVAYIRRGGDPIGPWHPSSYVCPRSVTTNDLLRSVLMHK